MLKYLQTHEHWPYLYALYCVVWPEVQEWLQCLLWGRPSCLPCCTPSPLCMSPRCPPCRTYWEKKGDLTTPLWNSPTKLKQTARGLSALTRPCDPPRPDWTPPCPGRPPRRCGRAWGTTEFGAPGCPRGPSENETEGRSRDPKPTCWG